MKRNSESFGNNNNNDNNNEGKVSPELIGSVMFDTTDWIKLKTLQFFSIIDSFNISLFLDEQVTLVIDRQISGPFSLIFTLQQLNERGIHNLTYFEDLKVTDKTKSIVFLCRPRLELIQKISQFIQQKQNSLKYYLIAIPNLDSSSNYLLESEGLLDYLKFESYDFGFIPYDNDLFSMEIGDFYSRCFVENDNYQLNSIGKSFIKLQQLYGPFKTIIGKGSKSSIISEYIVQHQTLIPPIEQSKLKTLILIDRTVDLIPLLCTQQTYQGLIDEEIKISNSQSIVIEKDIEIREQVLVSPPNQEPKKFEERVVRIEKEKKKLSLSPFSDQLYQQLKDLSFSSIPTMLYLNAQSISEGMNELKKSNSQLLSFPEIKKLLSRIPDVNKKQQLLELHSEIVEELLKRVNSDDFNQKISIEFEMLFQMSNNFIGSNGNTASTVLDFIENLIIRKKPMLQVLRLLSICCLTVGIKDQKQYQDIIKSFIHVYGIQEMTTLMRLEKAGLLGSKDNNLKFKVSSQLFKNFNLIFDTDKDNDKLKEYDQVYQGYIPLITRIIEEGQKNKQQGWFNKNLESKLNCIDQPFFIKELQNTTSNYDLNAFTMVMFVGGVSFAEISSLRTLKKKYGRGSGYDFIFGTTSLINGDNFLKNL
ncbi:hypothetical protein RB653_006276 [Dictyostelium firmibasis]|uniref:Sec1 family protein n=1 Tax=Dictyostelium firmibasis TaxID=79012 RepID=A0AAN7Z556_9MYCE